VVVLRVWFFDVSGGSRGVTTPAIFSAMLLSIAGFNVDVYVLSGGVCPVSSF